MFASYSFRKVTWVHKEWIHFLWALYDPDLSMIDRWMLPTYAEDDVEAFEGDQVGDRYSCLLGLNPCLLLILLIMLLKDVDVDIYRSSCCPCCRTLFRRSLVTASETAIRVAVTPDREQGFVVVERSCCFVQDKTHLFCKWLFTEKHVKVKCTMYLPRQHRAQWRLSTGLHLYRSQQAMGPPLAKLNLLVFSNFWSLSPPLWRV